MPRDYIGNGNGTDRGLDITAKLSTFQSPSSSLDTSHDSNSRLLGRSSLASNDINTTALTNNNTDLTPNLLTFQGSFTLERRDYSSSSNLGLSSVASNSINTTAITNNNTDLVWYNKATGQNAAWLMNGTTLSSTVNLANVYNESFTVTYNAPLTMYSRTINVLSPTSGKLSFQNNGGDNYGAILDDVQLSRIG
jgi:hypothetical protein